MCGRYALPVSWPSYFQVHCPDNLHGALSVNKSTASQNIQRTQMSANGLMRIGSFLGTTLHHEHTLLSFAGVPPPSLPHSRARMVATKT